MILMGDTGDDHVHMTLSYSDAMTDAKWKGAPLSPEDVIRNAIA
jgi:hypothetical protein